MEKKLNYLILIMLVFVVVTAPMTSAMAAKKATIVALDEEWKIDSDTRYDCFSTASGGFAITFEGPGWWIFRSSITFIPTEEGLNYETGWWLWKETGTVAEVESVNNSNNSFYEEQKVWHVTVNDEHIQFFYIKYNSSMNTSLLEGNNTILFFGQSMDDQVAGVMYETDMSILTVRAPTLTDMYKFQKYME